MTTTDRTRIASEIRRWTIASMRARELHRADLVAELEPDTYFDLHQVQSSADLLEIALHSYGHGSPEVTMPDKQPTPLQVALAFAFNQLRRPVVAAGIAIALLIGAWLLFGRS